VGFLDDVERRAGLASGLLLLAEGEDERVLHATERLSRLPVAEVALVGSPERVREAARRAGVALARVRVLDAGDPERQRATEASLLRARGERLAAEERRRLAQVPLYQAAAAVAAGEAQAVVAGAVTTTAEVLRAALWLLGTAPGVETVSSYFAMVRGEGKEERVLFFADGGVVPDPTPAQLADIGIATADNFRRLTGREPHVAFLSFSTLGSARHPRVDRVREAVARARARRPDLHADGELQVDAALDPEVARLKAPGSRVAGRANVLVFPDLDSANIGYKLLHRLGGWNAYGPILQGLGGTANDLSRGASSQDVYRVSLFALAAAAGAARGAAAGGRPA
jgi:phosphate acetyltransferase